MASFSHMSLQLNDEDDDQPIRSTPQFRTNGTDSGPPSIQSSNALPSILRHAVHVSPGDSTLGADIVGVHRERSQHTFSALGAVASNRDHASSPSASLQQQRGLSPPQHQSGDPGILRYATSRTSPVPPASPRSRRTGTVDVQNRFFSTSSPPSPRLAASGSIGLKTRTSLGYAAEDSKRTLARDLHRVDSSASPSASGGSASRPHRSALPSSPLSRSVSLSPTPLAPYPRALQHATTGVLAIGSRSQHSRTRIAVSTPPKLPASQPVGKESESHAIAHSTSALIRTGALEANIFGGSETAPSISGSNAYKPPTMHGLARTPQAQPVSTSFDSKLQQPLLALHPERLRAEAVILRSDVSRLTSQVAALESDLSSARERTVEAEARGRMLARRVASLEAEDAALRQELAETRGGLRAQELSSGSAVAAPLSSDAADAIRAEVGELRAELLTLGKDLAMAIKSRDDARAELGAVETALKTERGSNALSAVRAVLAKSAAATMEIAARQRTIDELRVQTTSLHSELEALQAELSDVRHERESQQLSIETQNAAWRAEIEALHRTVDDLRSQQGLATSRAVSELQLQLTAVRAEKDASQRASETLATTSRAERESQQRMIESLQRMLDETHAKLTALKGERDSLQRSFDSQLSAARNEKDVHVRALETQTSTLQREVEARNRSAEALQRALDDARKQAATLQLERDTAAQSAQAVSRARETSHLEAQKLSRELHDSQAAAQVDLEAERQRRVSAEWAVEQALAELERAKQQHALEMQAMTAAAESRISTLQSDVSRLQRSASTAANVEAELRSGLADADARCRASIAKAKSIEEERDVEQTRVVQLQEALEDSVQRLRLVEAGADKLPGMQAAVAALQKHVVDLKTTSDLRVNEAARELRLCQAQVRELEETVSDTTVEIRELRVELEQAKSANVQFLEALENEHDRSEELLREVSQLRESRKQQLPLPDEVTRSLVESREAIAELTRNLREQEATTSALRAECEAYRTSADTASDAAHGAMVTALRAQISAGGSTKVPYIASVARGGSESASVWSGGESLSPTSVTASRIMHNGEAALADYRIGHQDAIASSQFSASTLISKLRAKVASRDATISSLRTECGKLERQVSALQAELAVYRKVDVYSVTLQKEMKALSSRHS